MNEKASAVPFILFDDDVALFKVSPAERKKYEIIVVTSPREIKLEYSIRSIYFLLAIVALDFILNFWRKSPW